MEVELKYIISEQVIADAIWENELFKEYEEEGSREECILESTYYDTAEMDLLASGISYRVRKDGNRIIATVKWKGHTEDGLHVRQEINVPVESCEPDVNALQDSSIGNKIKTVAEKKKLQPFVVTRFQRRRLRIDTGKGLFEMSIDTGKIITDYGTKPISEVEIELFSGENDELLRVGKQLVDKFNLASGNETKYSRGLGMIPEAIIRSRIHK